MIKHVTLLTKWLFLSFKFKLLFLAVIGVIEAQNSQIDQNRETHPIFRYPYPKASQMNSDDSPTRSNVNKEIHTDRNIQLRRRNSRSSYNIDDDNFLSNLLRKGKKGRDSISEYNEDPDMRLAIRNSIRQTIPNFENDPSLSKKDTRHQTSLNIHANPDMNFLRKGIVRQISPDSNKEDFTSSRQNSPNSKDESDYDTEYSYDHPKQEQKRQTTSTDDSMYELAQDDDVSLKIPSESNKRIKSLEAKRDAFQLYYTRAPRPQVTHQLEQNLKAELDKIIKDNSTCADCAEVKVENEHLKAELENDTYNGDLLPAYACDQWFSVNQTCWLDRNIGDTVTFVLRFSDGPKRNSFVQWRQEFHLMNSNKRRVYNIDSGRPMWNVVIGSRGHELRISPITEIDIDSNSFSAVLVNSRQPSVHKKHKVNFRIRLIPIDQGLVYPGETIILNMRHTTLPQAGLRFRWFMEGDGEGSTLPSNMRLSPGGDVLFISELRQEQEGNVSCSVFTNKGFFATKQRYMLKEIRLLNSVLLFPPSPDHTRKKRSVDPEENVEQALETLEAYDPDKFREEHGFELPLVVQYIDDPIDQPQDTDNNQPQFDNGPDEDLFRNKKPPEEDGFEYRNGEIVENNRGEIGHGAGNTQSQTKMFNGQIEHLPVNSQSASDQIIYGASYSQHDTAADVSHIGHVTGIANSENRESNIVNDILRNRNRVTEIGNTHPRSSNLENRNLNLERNNLENRNLNLERNNLQNRNLNLERNNLENRNLNLENRDMKQINLENSNHRSSNIEDNNLGSSNLGGINHKISNIEINDLGRNNLQHSNLGSSYLGSHNFINNNDLRINNLRSNGIKKGNLVNSNIRNSKLEKSNFLNRNLLSSNQYPPGIGNYGVAEDDEMEETNRNNNKIENIIMEVDRRPETALARAEDSIAKLMSSCTSDLECAPDAVCVQGSGFCRCTLGFQGNGLFCWAEVQLRSNGIPVKWETPEQQNMQMQQESQKIADAF